MRINVTAGEILNRILTEKYGGERFVPFCEAMCRGDFHAPPFSEAFIRERCSVHGVSEEEYREKLSGLLAFLENVNGYDEVVLWFGDEPFCAANRKVMLDTLKQYHFRGSILSNTVIEETGEIIRQERLMI